MKTAFSLLFLLLAGSSECQTFIHLPEANLVNENGKIVSTSTISNFDNPTVVITYAKSWCHPCVLILDSLQKYYSTESKKSGVAIVAINVEADLPAESVFTHAKRWPSFTIFNDSGGSLMTAMKTNSAPKIFFLDANQNVVYCSETIKITAATIYKTALLIKQKQISASKIFFDKDWKPCAQDAASYYGTIEKQTNGLYWRIDYYINGKIQMKQSCELVYPVYREGETTFYNENGTKSSQTSYSQNKVSGLYTEWDKTGVLYSKINYKDGKQNGLWQLFHPNGTVANEGKMVNGKADGNWKHYYPNGTKKRETIWKNGEKTFCLGWHENGTIKYKISEFGSSNVPVDPELFYSSGKRVNVFTYDKDSVIIGLKQYYENGEIKSEAKLTETSINFTEFHKGGNVKMKYTLDDDLQFEGKFISWYNNGQKNLEMEFDGGKIINTNMCWYENGQVKEKIDFTTGRAEFYASDGTALGNGTKSILEEHGKEKGRKELMESSIYYFIMMLDEDLREGLM